MRRVVVRWRRSWWWWVCASPKSWVVHLVVGQRRAVVRDPAVAHHDRAVDQGRHRAELVGDQHDRRAALLEHAAARRPAPAGWAGRRRRSARRGRTARARRRGPGRSAPAAAARRRAVVTPSRGAVGEPDDVERVVDRRPVGARERAQQPAAGRAGRTATTSQTEAGTPEAAPARCGTKPIRCQSRKSRERGAEQLERARRCSGRRPVSARTSVDLPEPLAPISATNSPGPDRQVDAAQDRPAADGDRAVRRADGRGSSSAAVRLLQRGEVRRASAKGSPRRRSRRSGPRSGRARRCSMPRSSASVSARSRAGQASRRRRW